MARIAWRKAEDCPVVNGYVIRVMTEKPKRSRSATQGSRVAARKEPPRPSKTDGTEPHHRG